MQEIKGAKRRLYLITISAQQKKDYISKEELDDVALWLTRAGVILANKIYETHGTYSQLHIHCFAWITEDFRWKPYTQYGDTEHMTHTFRVQWSYVYDIPGAITYLTKQITDKYKQEQVHDENYYKHHYGFIEA